MASIITVLFLIVTLTMGMGLGARHIFQITTQPKFSSISILPKPTAQSSLSKLTMPAKFPSNIPTNPIVGSLTMPQEKPSIRTYFHVPPIDPYTRVNPFPFPTILTTTTTLPLQYLPTTSTHCPLRLLSLVLTLLSLPSCTWWLAKCVLIISLLCVIEMYMVMMIVSLLFGVSLFYL